MKQTKYLLRYAYYSSRIAVNDLLIAVIKMLIYIQIFIFSPWWMARFYASWVEYQHSWVYRERLVHFGMAQAIHSFINSKFQQNYCLNLRLQKEPWLYWKIMFLPFSINVPEDLVRASEEGYFDPDIKFNII